MAKGSEKHWPSAGSQFESTHWSIVLEAGHESSPRARQALEGLCRTYWYPLYAYLRRRGHKVHDAQDLVQEFFARLLARRTISVADPSRGRFRSFLLTALRNFVANEWDKARAEKRGGGSGPLPIDASVGESKYSLQPTHELTPERLYDKQWAATLLDHVLAGLREESIQAGKEHQFDCLKAFLAGRSSVVGYAEAARQLRMSEAAAMTAASRLRRRYRELLRLEIARTVAHPQEVEDEIRRLFDSLGR